MKIIPTALAGAIFGAALVSAAHVAGLVAREGLGPDLNPANPTALVLIWFTIALMACAGATLAMAMETKP
jgi:hypothetical protein